MSMESPMLPTPRCWTPRSFVSQPLAGQQSHASSRAPPKRKPSRNRDPHCTNHCPYEAFVDGGNNEEVRPGRSRERDPQPQQLPPQELTRPRSTSRTRSVTRTVFGGEDDPDIINDEAKAVQLGTKNSILQTKGNKASKGSDINLRIESVGHWKKDGHCIIRFTISITINRGNATLQDTTFKLRFRSSDTKKRLLAVVDYSASHDRPLSDTTEVHHTAEKTIGLTWRLGHDNAGAEVQGQCQKGQEYTEPDQYRLELSNASNDLDARLFRTGNRKTDAITPPTSFRIHVGVECPKGDGLDVIGRIDAQKSEKFVAVGDWSTVDLNRLITLRGSLDNQQVLPEGITGSREDIENYLSLTKLLNESGKAGDPVAQWCLPILERHMRRMEEDRKRKEQEEENRKKEEERKRRTRRKGHDADGVTRK